MYGGWRFLYASYRSYEPASIVPVHKQMEAGWRSGFFWQVNPCRIMSKQSLLHGGSILKPPLHSVQGRHSHKGRKNGGLDFLKAAAGVFKAWRLPAVRRLFFFAVVRQVIKLLCFFVSVQNYRLRLVNKLPDYLSLSC